MIYTQCGKLGHLSVVGLGCWNFGAQWNKTSEDEAIRIIRAAIDGGINYVDVAESYGYPDGQCEMILGKALKDGYREKVFLVSKVGWYGRREADNMTAKSGFIERQIKRIFNKLYRYKTVDLQERTPEIVRLSGHACCGRLQTSCIDLLLCHDGAPKDVMPFIEGFRQLKKDGFIRFYGISTDSLDVLKRFYEASNGECAACECDYSILNRNAEDGIFKFCTEHNIAILTRGTLCRGILSGKYNLDTVFKEQSRIMWNKGGVSRWQYEGYMQQIEALKERLKTESLAKVAYRYAFSRPEHPTVVMGCTSMEQLKDNLDIASSYLDDDSRSIVESLTSKRGGVKVLLIGGSGTLSKAILKESFNRGDLVTIINRGRRSNQVPVGVEHIICDVTDGKMLEDVLKDSYFDVVVDFYSRTKEDINRIYPLFQNSCKQYIFISTACVYRRDKEDLPLKESSPKPNTVWSYNSEKYECEQTLKRLSKESPSRYTIVRPYITYDEERIPFGIAPDYKYHRTIIERIKNGKPMFIWGDGHELTTSTYVSDFAKGVVGLFLNPKAVDEEFHITSSTCYRQEELLTSLFGKLGKKEFIVKVPVSDLVKQLPEYKSMLLGDRVLPAVFDNHKIEAAVPGYVADVTLSEGLDKVLEHYKELNTYKYDYAYEGRIDKMLSSQGIKCHFKAYPHSTSKDRVKYYINRYLPYRLSCRIKIK